MVTFTIRPNADVSAGTWSAVPLWSKIEEIITQPTAGDGIRISASATTTCIIDMETSILPTGEVGETVTVWVYGKAGSLDTYSVAYSIGAGAASSFQSPSQNDVTYQWGSKSWSGLSLSQVDIDAIRIHLKNTSYGVGSSSVDTIYVTITTISTGWGHKFNGVAGASIGKISGVAIGNIASVKGVDI